MFTCKNQDTFVYIRHRTTCGSLLQQRKCDSRHFIAADVIRNAEDPKIFGCRLRALRFGKIDVPIIDPDT